MVIWLWQWAHFSVLYWYPQAQDLNPLENHLDVVEGKFVEDVAGKFMQISCKHGAES